MDWQRFSHLMRLVLVAAALCWGVYPGQTQAAYTPPPALPGPCTAGGPTPCVDYFGVANYANSPLPAGPIGVITVTGGGTGYSASPTVTITDFVAGAGAGATASATVVGGTITAITVTTAGSGYIAPQVTITDATGTGAAAVATLGTPAVGTGIRKFVDTLPGLCGVAGATNGLGQCIPIATADTATFAGSDFYRIGLSDYTQQMHTDLPATKLRGYAQVDAAGNPIILPGSTKAHQYLGPLIVARKDRPVRVQFVNQLANGNLGDLFLPVDTTYMGAGMAPNGEFYSQNRATIHLHGGNSPWISDGTPHQWITPANESTTYQKGDSFENVPDMVGAASPIGMTSPTPADGKGTYYWTNQQSERLLFYHDHAYGMTRLNVYAGEAAGYLILDPVQEDALQAAGAPGTLGTLVGGTTPNDLTHIIPLVIQDKTFVPMRCQRSGIDPTGQIMIDGPFRSELKRHGGMGQLCQAAQCRDPKQI